MGIAGELGTHVVEPVVVKVWADNDESKYVLFEFANNNNLVFAIAVNGTVGTVKLEVYNAVPFIHLKLLINPSNCAPKFVEVSLPIVNKFPLFGIFAAPILICDNDDIFAPSIYKFT